MGQRGTTVPACSDREILWLLQSKSVFIEPPSNSAPSLALALFAPGSAPGFLSERGLAKPSAGACDKALALLLRTQKGKSIP